MNPYVQGNKIIGRHASWTLLEAPHRNGNTTKSPGRTESYLARALCELPGHPDKIVTLHIPADLALAWCIANP